ncbi:hypothetical protein RISK_006585 [Rhodopirellula islandica]|uniref:Uncharacterized protein n=1 Tax=Rhodopirellula islandica TaxID=595434 RepID=A0A0J1E7I9_RHOIS|nr:hypothetical protein RISK_006585 [Rhodopirellula islandica]
MMFLPSGEKTTCFVPPSDRFLRRDGREGNETGAVRPILRFNDAFLQILISP